MVRKLGGWEHDVYLVGKYTFEEMNIFSFQHESFRQLHITSHQVRTVKHKLTSKCCHVITIPEPPVFVVPLFNV